MANEYRCCIRVHEEGHSAEQIMENLNFDCATHGGKLVKMHKFGRGTVNCTVEIAQHNIIQWAGEPDARDSRGRLVPGTLLFYVAEALADQLLDNPAKMAARR